MSTSRRTFLTASGAGAAGLLAGATLGVSPAQAIPQAAEGNPIPQPRSRKSLRMRTGRPGLQWVTYGYNQPRNMNIPEAEWKRNIDWFIANFKQYGYDTVCTDGWIESSQRVNRNGYIISQNDEWQHDFIYWIEYLRARGMNLSIYYNPFWITQSARADRSIRVAGRSDVAVADLTADWDPFTPDKIYWLDPNKDGAKEYAQGMVRYFKRLGAVRIRSDFLSWFDTGWDQNLGQIQREHGRDSYLKLIDWLDEAAGTHMTVSLVLPNMDFHGSAERSVGDSFRVDDDAGSGGWTWLSGNRQTWRPFWTQWSNPFTGFTGWADINGPDLIGLDGDFLIASGFATDDERRTGISLFTLAGSPICVSDTVDTIADHAWVFQNPEMIAVNQDGFAGKPIFHSNHGYNWDTTSRDTERWVGQTSDGSWVVGLFNRGDEPNTRSIDFATDLGLPGAVAVRDLWTHTDLGAMTSYTANLPTHGCAVLKLTPAAGPRRYDAQLGGWSGGAVFDNDTAGYTGFGYVTNLQEAGATVSFAVDGGTGGSADASLRFALAAGGATAVKITVLSGTHVDRGHTQQVSLRGKAGTWTTQTSTLTLNAGRNIVLVTGTGRAAGQTHLDYLTVG
jgi:glucan 1,6-alpha-isomaltosidase